MGFGERLRAAMLAAGIGTPAQLAKRCGNRFTRQTAARWLEMDTAELSSELLVVVSECLNTRATWLVTGKGGAAREHAMRALAIVDRLDPDTAERWLKMGERMAG